MLFMLHESVTLKGGKGITHKVTYLGPQFLGEILQHKVRNENGQEFLVNGTLLSSMDTPDISTIPVSVKQYAVKLPKLTRKQLQRISNPEILDDDQCELMGLHYKMNHLPLLAMITLSEKGLLNKICLTQEQTSGLYVLYLWNSALQTVVYQRCKERGYLQRRG